jgi:thiamine-phosphate diphosphorylase
MLVTDRSQSVLPLEELVSRSLNAGVEVVQIREKQVSSSERAAIIESLLVAGVEPAALSINDDIDVALRYGIGLHLPEWSLSPLEARAVLGPQALIGRSVHSPAEAERSEGADYVIAGHVFPTPSKAGLEPLGLEGFRRIVEASPVPVLAIGGITADRVADVINAGAAGVAVMSAISASRQPEGIARSIRLALDEALKGADTWRLQQR